MDRRKFIKGLLGTAAIAAIGVSFDVRPEPTVANLVRVPARSDIESRFDTLWQREFLKTYHASGGPFGRRLT